MKAFQEGVALYRQVHQEDELSLTLAHLASVEICRGLFDLAREHLDEALHIAAETGSWQACLGVIGKTALFMVMQGKVELGIEVYTLATRYPYLGKSIYWWDSTGKFVDELAARLPEAVRIAAIERGQKRNLQDTVRELFSWIQA
jgi:hypothetical protein